MNQLRTWTTAVFFALSSLLVATTSIAADTTPVTFKNLYKTKMYGFAITVTNSLTKTSDDQFDMLFRFDSMIGNISETSRLKWDSATHTVIPQHYVYKRRGLGKNRDADLAFDWQKNSVTNQVQKSSWKMKLIPKVQDKLSYLLQLQQDFAHSNKTSHTYKIADGGSLKEYVFEKIGAEVLSTPLGNVETIKVKRSRANSDRTTYAWLAPKYNHILVRLEQVEKNESYTIDITSANINGKAIEKF